MPQTTQGRLKKKIQGIREKMISLENSLDKSNPPPLENDCSTKKAKFRQQGEDGDNPPVFTFRDKLLESQYGVEGESIGRNEFVGREDYLDIEKEDVIIEGDGSIPSITFSQRVHEQLIKPRQATVVVKLLGRMIGYKALASRLETLWPNIGVFSIIDLDNGYYLVRFCSKNAAEFVLTQGSWVILGHYLTVQQWTPQFDCFNEKIDKIVAWIRLPGMPLHYYHKKIIRMLGHVVGRVLKIDYNTEQATRGKFARITIEVYLDKPLVSQFWLDGKLQKAEYESLPTICFGCGR